MFGSKLRVELSEGLVLGLPFLDLTLELGNELVFGLHLRTDVGRETSELVLESFDSLASVARGI